MAKDQVFAAVFNKPVQFLGLEGVDETRVYTGRVDDVPAAVGDSKAFGIYKEAGDVVVVGDLEDAPEPEKPEASPGLEGNVAEVLENAKGLSKDQLLELKAKEAGEQNRKGVINGLDGLIAAKG